MAQKNNLKISEHGNVKLIDVPCFLAKYEDGHGKESVRVGFVVGGEVRFLQDSVLSKPAQSWLKEDILVALGLKEPEKKADGSGLETQV